MPFRARIRVAVALAAAVLTTALPAQTLHQRPKNEAKPPVAAAGASAAQRPVNAPTLQAGTSLQVEAVKRYGMKKGETIDARLMHPIYADNLMVVAAGTELQGRVVGLRPNHKERVAGWLNGDFTPFRTPVVRFDVLELPSGAVKIEAATATDGAPVLYLRTPHATKHKSLIGREWAAAKQRVRDQIAYFTPPGLRLRLLTLLYRQLPYHPQWIAAHTAWSFELEAPAELPEDAALEAETAHAMPAAATPKNASGPELWHVRAVLENGLSSSTAKPGDAVKALVVEPVFDKDEHLVVPQGSVLAGKVTKAKAARRLGRDGSLRFSFEQLQLPKGYRRQVQGELAGAATDLTQNLKLDAEGTVTPRSRKSAIAPLLLTVLAVKGLDQDGNLTAQTTAASNGFGIVGRVVGIAMGNRSVATGIGMYAAALSFSNNFLRHGQDVVFPKDTRIEIETTPMRAKVLKPEGR